MTNLVKSAIALCFFGTAIGSAVAAGPSFSCLKAETPDEIAICNSAELSELDNYSASGFQYVRNAFGINKAKSIAVPVLKARRECGADVNCIRAMQIWAIEQYSSLGAPISIPNRPANVTAAGPSFSCLKAETLDEITICNSVELSELDNLSASGFEYVRNTVGVNRAKSIAVPVLKARKECGANVNCIRAIQIRAIKQYISLGAPTKGHAEAEFTLGSMYANGRGVPQDDFEAVDWYRLAAEQGHTEAQFSLGNMYDLGRGVPQDSVEAVKWYRLAAEQGSTRAHHSLANAEARLKANEEATKATAENAAPPAEPLIASATDLGRRVALVIGNSIYRNAAILPNPANDARDVAEALKNAGFKDLTLLFDLDRSGLRDALAAFADKAASADWAVVYYSGHGIEIQGINYLIPVDAALKTDRQVRFEAVALDDVTSAVKGARQLSIVILDACRDDPFLTRMAQSGLTRSVSRGLARVEPSKGTLVVYAAKAGEVALDGDGANSPFAKALVDQLDEPGLEVNLMFRRIRDAVLRETGNRQEPFTYGSLPAEELFFVPG